MIIILGIGNPEKKYKGTRHNLGKEIIDFLFKEWKKNYNFSSWKKKKFCQISEGKMGKRKIILAKNLTFMNNCGLCAKELVKNRKMEMDNFIVIHDDFDIPLGKIKVSQNRSSAGHKGIESIIQFLKTKSFTRIRIGIKPSFFVEKPLDEFVLQRFKKEDLEILEKVKQEVIKILENIFNKNKKLS